MNPVPLSSKFLACLKKYLSILRAPQQSEQHQCVRCTNLKLHFRSSKIYLLCIPIRAHLSSSPMDPLSIAASSATLVAACVSISGFMNRIQSVDTAAQILGIETDSLSKVLGDISMSFSDPSLAKIVLKLQTGHEAVHWRSVQQTMEDCKETLGDLRGVLGKKIGKPGGGFLRRSKTTVNYQT